MCLLIEKAPEASHVLLQLPEDQVCAVASQVSLYLADLLRTVAQSFQARLPIKGRVVYLPYSFG